MKKTLAFVIAAVILFSCIVVPSFAEEYKLGDVNRDGKFNAHDVSLMMKVVARWDVEDSEFVKIAGDMNQDGKLNSSDAAELLRYVAWTWTGPIPH